MTTEGLEVVNLKWEKTFNIPRIFELVFIFKY